MTSTSPPPGVPAAKVKPRLRGVSHVIAFLAALVGWVAISPSSAAQPLHLAGAVYGASLVVMFGASALYHAPMWTPRARARLRKLDHASIFVLIAGSFTPMAVLDAGGRWSANVTWMWLAAAVGVVFVVAWSHAPRLLRSLLYVALGSLAAPVLLRLPAVIGTGRTLWLFTGACIYVLGAGVYARRWPNPKPVVFGYHEVFHLLVIAAAAVQYAALFAVLHGVKEG